MQPMVSVDDLAGFPGGPFTQPQVDSAVAQIRAVCGWHIAPEVTETIRVDSDGASILVLPTLRIGSIDHVTDASGVELSGWSWSDKGMLARPGGFPSGMGAVRVTLTHGYPTPPADLLAAVAARTSRRVMQESLGARSVTYASDPVSSVADIARFRLGPRP